LPAAPGRSLTGRFVSDPDDMVALMPVIRARTYSEAREYMRLAMATGDCTGSDLSIRDVASILEGEEWATTFAVDCSRCRAHREFTFITDPAPEDAPGGLIYGHGPQPSRLIDAGEWYVIFSTYLWSTRAKQAEYGGALPDLDTVETVLGWIEGALAAIDEILKFMPSGQNQVPESALWTDRGRAAYDECQDQFSRAVLERCIEELEVAGRAYLAKYQEAVNPQ
jgi:hypothetical protein